MSIYEQTTQNTAKQNYPGSVTSYDTRPAEEMGLFYNAAEPTLYFYFSVFLILNVQSVLCLAEVRCSHR